MHCKLTPGGRFYLLFPGSGRTTVIANVLLWAEDENILKINESTYVCIAQMMASCMTFAMTTGNVFP